MTDCGHRVFQTVLELDKLELTEPVSRLSTESLNTPSWCLFTADAPPISSHLAVPQETGARLARPEEGEGGEPAAGDGESGSFGPHPPVRLPSLTQVPPLQELLERQQMDEKINADKHLERKRESEQSGWFEAVTQHKVNQSFVARTGRDSKTSLSATKSMSMSSSGATLSSSGETAATTGCGHRAKLATLSPHFH